MNILNLERYSNKHSGANGRKATSRNIFFGFKKLSLKRGMKNYEN